MMNNNLTPSQLMSKDRQMDLLIATWLRIGVLSASLITLFGGAIYLIQHGGEPVRDYTHFDYTHLPQNYLSYTTFGGIWQGVEHFTATGWIQLGVLVLFLTPILRVVLSLIDFISQRDWIYICITATVLSVIIFNSLSPLL